MDKNSKEIEIQYDKIAKEWAEAFSGEHDKKPKDREMLNRFAQVVEEREPVWDLGCGPGNTSQYLKDLGLQISGLDISGEMLEKARTLHPNIPFQKGNILDLPFEKNSIAAIVAFYAIVHFTKDEVAAAFREIFRVLEPGGIFLFTYHIGEGRIHLNEFLGKEIDMDFMFFQTDFITHCLERAGFNKIEVFEREPYEGVEYKSCRAYIFAEKPVRKE